MSEHRSLRRLLIAGGTTIVVATGAVLAGLLLLFASLRSDFERDLRASRIEQRGADVITMSVYGQLLASYRQLQSPTAANRERFDSLGRIAFDSLRTYLRQPMELASRLQVEVIKELHQSLEVDAHRAFDLVARGDAQSARAHIADMESRAARLETEMDKFVELREREGALRHAAQAARLQRQVAGLALMVVALGVYSLVFVSTVKNRVVRPLDQLSDASRRLGSGDLSARIPEQRHSELSAVAGSFNEMATRMRDANVALERSEVRYRRLFDEAPIALYRTSPEGVLLDANPALVELLGYASSDNIVGADVRRWYVNVADRDAFAATMDRDGIIRDQQVELRRPDGTAIWVADTTRRVGDPESGQVSYEGGLTDISERRRAEDALRESDQRFREMAEHIKEAFFVVDLTTGKPLYVSPTWAEIWGRPLSEGYDAGVWSRAVHPDDRAQVAASQAAVARGGADESVFRVVRPDGATRWVRSRAFPVRNDRGEVHRMVGVSEDITELRQVEERFTQAQKMEAVGRLAGGVAHDFNNLLTVILGEAEMVQGSLAPGSCEAESLAEIRKASDSAVLLTRQLLAFSRKQLVEPVVFSLNDAVADTGKMLRRLIGEDVKIEMRLSADSASVRADRGQIEQVLTNLAVNARDAMPSGGVLSIETATTTLDREHPEGADVAPGPYVMLSVRDTGVGMSADVRAHAFEPFFTTKERGKGTGLGLATSHGIVRQAGGTIAIYSEQGMGTTFRIYLPRVPEAAAPVVIEAAQVHQRGNETILMVEDEAVVGRVGARILRGQGYKVLEARDAPEALRALTEHTDPVHLLFTDVVLPGIGGRELAERVRAARPGIRILFTSGYTDDVILQHQLAAQDVMILQKPYTRGSLSQKVRMALDARATL